MAKNNIPAELAEIIAIHRNLFHGFKMVDTSDNPPADSTGDDDDNTDEADKLGDGGKKALDAMRAELKALKKANADKEAKITSFEDASKSELEKATGSASKNAGIAQAATARAELAERKLLVHELAGDADPNRLLKFTDFLDEIKEMELSDRDGFKKAINDVLKKEPWLRRGAQTDGDAGKGHRKTKSEKNPTGRAGLAASFEEEMES